jgi:hypothetical protein
MASTSEKTLGNNVDSLGKLITKYTEMGTAYSPGREALNLSALNALKTAAAAAHKAVGDQKLAYGRIVAERAAAYKPLDKLVTRCLNIFLTSDALDQVKDGAKTLANKVRGMGSSPTPPPPTTPEQTPEEKKHSTMQQSFTMKLENFGLLIEMFRNEPTYLPGKDDIKVDALKNLSETLAAKNGAVDAAFVLYKSKLGERDRVFFDEKTGLVDIALDTKKYIKGDFGTDSDEYKAISSISFTRKKKK